jgi:2-C-methyl-D-erythritol 4-phosphate cytidylyltransferase
MLKYAIIVAGGTGTRMGGDIPKQFQFLNGKSVLWHSVKAFTDAYKDIKIILILPEAHLAKGELLASEFSQHSIEIAQGGETRFQSVKNGLQLIKQEATIFVHDAVRCLVTTKLIYRCEAAALEKGNAIPAVAATDTIRIETNASNEQVDRKRIRIIQTPQTFLSSIIKPAFSQSYQEAFTDEASVVEKTGVKINLIEGETTNIKITFPVDLLIAEKILKEEI